MSSGKPTPQRGRPRSPETQRLFDGVHGMLPRDADSEEMSRRCYEIGGQKGIAMMQEFVASRRAGAEKRVAEAHARQNAERARYGGRARHYADLVVSAYNANSSSPDWRVLTTLVSLYLAIADGGSRLTSRDGAIIEDGALDCYWPSQAPKSWAAIRCFVMACRAGRSSGNGRYLDMHDRYPSRTGYPGQQETNASQGRLKQRKIAIGVDGQGGLVELGLREKRELQAASYVTQSSAGAWLGFMAMIPPDDWDAPRTLPNKHWSLEWGHPACILPERRDDIQSMFDSSIFPLLLPPERELGDAAVERVRSWRLKRQRYLDEPSFSYDEAIKVLGAVVGICSQSEAAARNMFRFCTYRERAGRLSPRWSLRLCWADRCDAPLFIHKILDSNGNANLPNYCPGHSGHGEAARRRRHRGRLKNEQ